MMPIRWCAEFQRAGTSVIAARTGGFRGDSYRGYGELLKVLFKDYVRTSRRKTPGLVNLWGVPPGQDVFWRGNLDALRGLLEKLGLEVNAFFTGHDTLQNIAGAGSAELNVVVSPLLRRGSGRGNFPGSTTRGTWSRPFPSDRRRPGAS